MFRWYRDAEKCYVYLADVSSDKVSSSVDGHDEVQSALCDSRWFRRGWTLQELLAPKTVEFFSQQQKLIGTKETLLQPIHYITGIPIAALQGAPLSHYSVSEKMQWAAPRQTKKPEDKAYCLFGIFDVYLPLIYGEGENAFQRLREAIDRGLSMSQTSSHTHWYVPRSANALFTGRTEILENFEDLIRKYMAMPSGTQQCRVVISGIGGQGKSEICLQLARILRNRFWAVLWIDVSTGADAERSYMDIARKLSIPATSWGGTRHGISNLKHPWLIILDNADDLSIDYSIYFPDGNPGVVILTSRNIECQQYASTETCSVVLEGLAIQESQRLLLQAACVRPDQHGEQDHAALVVAQLLQSHALALIQAGAYVANHHCTLSEYPRMYEQQRRRLLEFRPKQAKSRYGDVYTTFEVSAGILKNSEDEAAHDALLLLPMLAACGPTRFPLSLFEAAWQGVRPSNIASEAGGDVYGELLTRWHVSHLPAFLDVTAEQWDPFRLNEAIRVLRTLSLITVDSENGQIYTSMHALVHAWARDRQDQHEAHQSWLRMGCVAAFACVGDDLSQQIRWRSQPHYEALVLWDMNTVYGNKSQHLVTRILVNFGWSFDKNKSLLPVIELIGRIVSHLGPHFCPVIEKWIALRRLAAYVLGMFGRVNESVALFKELLRFLEQSMSDNTEHKLLLVCQHGLANVYVRNQQSSRAIPILELTLKSHLRISDEDDPNRLSTELLLAEAYCVNGKDSEAIILLEYVVEVYTRSQAQDNLQLLTAQRQLAIAYANNGRASEALTLLEHMTIVQARSLDKDHPEQLKLHATLANVQLELGDTEAACAEMERVIEIWKR